LIVTGTRTIITSYGSFAHCCGVRTHSPAGDTVTLYSNQKRFLFDLGFDFAKSGIKN